MGGRVGGEVQERWVGLEQPESLRQRDSLLDSVHNRWIREVEIRFLAAGREADTLFSQKGLEVCNYDCHAIM